MNYNMSEVYTCTVRIHKHTGIAMGWDGMYVALSSPTGIV